MRWPSILALSLVLPTAVLAAGRWERDAETGCEIWNNAPRADARVRWWGDCVDGKAEGGGLFTRTLDWGGRRVSARYAGLMRAGKMHGHGSYYFFDNSRYVGDFRDGEFHGQGILYFADGTRFEGSFVNGRAHGPGTCNGVNTEPRPCEAIEGTIAMPE